MMYQVKDYVVYGSAGVCQVTNICEENFDGQTSKKYYVLSPVYGNQVDIFIPLDKKNAPLRPVWSKKQIMELIRSMPEISSEWIKDDNSRKEKFSEFLRSGDLKKIAHLIKMMHSRQENLQKIGKRLGFTDSETMKQAEKILNSELALVMDLQLDQVLPFIKEQIQSSRKLSPAALSS